MTVRIAPQHVAMRGSERHPPRCISLQGEIGSAVHCSIYALRASPCRDFQASWVDGIHNERCDRARAAHGLPPLMPDAHAMLAEAPQPIPPALLTGARKAGDASWIADP